MNNPTILKPRPSTYIGMMLGGAFIAWIGFGAVRFVDGTVAKVCALFGLMGLGWIVVGTVTLRRRGELAIRIDSQGIELPVIDPITRVRRRRKITADEILDVHRHDSLQGRTVHLELASGESVVVEVRQYCPIDCFLKYCREHELGVAQQDASTVL